TLTRALAEVVVRPSEAASAVSSIGILSSLNCASGAPSVAWRDAPRSLAIGFRRAHGLWDLATSNDPSIDVSQAVSLLVPGVFLLDEGSPRVPELSPLGGRSFEELSEAAGDVLHVGAHDDSPF